MGFQKLLVVKRLLPHLSEDDEFIQMFFDEARIAALLNHPNIAQIYDLGEVDGIYYIAMEYVHGEAVARGERARPSSARAGCRWRSSAASSRTPPRGSTARTRRAAPRAASWR